LLEPQRGKILYNNVPLQEMLDLWRAQVAYLPQEIFLTDDTLRNNVAMGIPDPEIDVTRVQESLHKARMKDFVDQLPDGLNTLMGERGVRFSGGQRQRVALARAFYHGRSVLVMDEATSSLDNKTEQEIVEEIHHLKGRKTLIVIAHRLTTVQHCDRIYKLDQGRIVESGTFEQVIGSDKTVKVL
jgi:ABC-type multidrug transport system fused ATPase/permease subunit